MRAVSPGARVTVTVRRQARRDRDRDGHDQHADVDRIAAVSAPVARRRAARWRSAGPRRGPRARARAPRTTSSTMIDADEDGQPQGAERTRRLAGRAPGRRPRRPRPRAAGARSDRAAVDHDAGPHGSAGPTPIRNRSATKIGAVTRVEPRRADADRVAGRSPPRAAAAACRTGPRRSAPGRGRC